MCVYTVIWISAKTEVNFLGHHISQHGIEPNSSKIERVLNWPVSKNASKVHGFLGLVRYISVFLPKLADHTCILTPLTTKEAKKKLPTMDCCPSGSVRGNK